MSNSETRRPELALTERDMRMLVLLYRFRLLNRDQLMAIAPFQSLTRANTRLGALVRAGLLSRKPIPIVPGNGSAQAVYSLGPGSSAFLKVDPSEVRRRARQVRRWDLGQVEHVLAANEVLVRLGEAIRKSQHLSLISFHTETELRQAFSGRALVPDGWIAWHDAGLPVNWFFELDLHHEGLTEWRGKLLRYLNYASSGLHKESFGFDSFAVLVVTKTVKRLQSICRLAEPVADFFRFATIDSVRHVITPAQPRSEDRGALVQ